MTTIGILHPGEMGAAVGAALTGIGHEVLWLADGRSPDTRRRARAAGLRPTESLAALTARCEIVLSICPPDAALDVARAVAGYAGLYVDANAIAPDTARAVAAIIGPGYVDGSIIGPPPTTAGTTRLYLSGDHAPRVSDAFTDSPLRAPILREDPFAASALKMVYAGWTKGSSALLLAVAQAAQRLGVLDALQADWAESQPALPDRLTAASAARDSKGWRWSGEMREVAATLDSQGVPGGFHEAAAEIYGSAPRPPADRG